ncbi:hypothetical protein ROZALSC1DRAFT_27317 [Rozella allomycis CSF55]|uniref:Uncharacterized protein n=1 Tax=Rozella allomycis (strain CSF55) TaxID=988480 RepID=A0A4P9YNS5_ROZAC|nr:hypothetical protein ROZALSC1DRAFT_27317 [Rozella allomycis CSF55]
MSVELIVSRLADRSRSVYSESDIKYVVENIENGNLSCKNLGWSLLDEHAATLSTSWHLGKTFTSKCLSYIIAANISDKLEAIKRLVYITTQIDNEQCVSDDKLSDIKLLANIKVELIEILKNSSWEEFKELSLYCIKFCAIIYSTESVLEKNAAVLEKIMTTCLKAIFEIADGLNYQFLHKIQVYLIFCRDNFQCSWMETDEQIILLPFIFSHYSNHLGDNSVIEFTATKIIDIIRSGIPFGILFVITKLNPSIGINLLLKFNGKCHFVGYLQSESHKDVLQPLQVSKLVIKRLYFFNEKFKKILNQALLMNLESKTSLHKISCLSCFPNSLLVSHKRRIISFVSQFLTKFKESIFSTNSIYLHSLVNHFILLLCTEMKLLEFEKDLVHLFKEIIKSSPSEEISPQSFSPILVYHLCSSSNKYPQNLLRQTNFYPSHNVYFHNQISTSEPALAFKVDLDVAENFKRYREELNMNKKQSLSEFLFFLKKHLLNVSKFQNTLDYIQTPKLQATANKQEEKEVIRTKEKIVDVNSAVEECMQIIRGFNPFQKRTIIQKLYELNN